MGLQPISREHSDHILDFEDWKGGERFKVIFQPNNMLCGVNLEIISNINPFDFRDNSTSSQLYTVSRSKGYHQ